MKCNHEKLESYLDEALEEEERKEVEQHLKGCSRCQRYLEELRITEKLMLGPNSKLFKAVQTALEEKQSRKSQQSPKPTQRRWIPAALAVAAAFLLVILGWTLWTPTPEKPKQKLSIARSSLQVFIRPSFRGSADEPLHELPADQRLPLRDGAFIRLVRPKTSRPLYYYVWLVFQRKGKLLLSDELPQQQFRFPRNPEELTRINFGNTPGVIAIYVMARDTPLPEDVSLSDLIARTATVSVPTVSQEAAFGAGLLHSFPGQTQPDLAPLHHVVDEQLAHLFPHRLVFVYPYGKVQDNGQQP